MTGSYKINFFHIHHDWLDSEPYSHFQVLQQLVIFNEFSYWKQQNNLMHLCQTCDDKQQFFSHKKKLCYVFVWSTEWSTVLLLLSGACIRTQIRTPIKLQKSIFLMANWYFRVLFWEAGQNLVSTIYLQWAS